MFVVLSYDINQKRVNKVLKVCRKYLVHVQKSVFEGTITEAKLNFLKKELKNILDYDDDGICIYYVESVKSLTKEEIGKVERNSNII
jgi:CRISPR-associated protein Cas2